MRSTLTGAVEEEEDARAWGSITQKTLTAGHGKPLRSYTQAWPDFSQARPEDEKKEVEEVFQGDHLGGGVVVRPDLGRGQDHGEAIKNQEIVQHQNGWHHQPHRLETWTFLASFSCPWPNWPLRELPVKEAADLGRGYGQTA